MAGLILRWRPRFGLSGLLWLTLVSAILMLWYRDHQSLMRRLNVQAGAAGKSWCIDQLLGKPDTPIAGDQASAWAPKPQNGGTQWVVAEFLSSVSVGSVEIVETYHPATIFRVASVSMAGTETTLWEGTDPVAPVSGMGTSVIKPSGTFTTRRIKLYLDTDAVTGWNEIDAIGLRDTKGKIQWASNAWASSSYGDNREAPKWFWP